MSENIIRTPVIHDPVNHPAHYTDGKYETINYIEQEGFGFHLGNAVKYISRAGKKDPEKKIEDLKKAVWYINRAMESNDKYEVRTRRPNSSPLDSRRDRTIEDSIILIGDYMYDKGITEFELQQALIYLAASQSLYDLSLAKMYLMNYIDSKEVKTHA